MEKKNENEMSLTSFLLATLLAAIFANALVNYRAERRLREFFSIGKKAKIERFCEKLEAPNYIIKDIKDTVFVAETLFVEVQDTLIIRDTIITMVAITDYIE
jgi:hypothetical protein